MNLSDKITDWTATTNFFFFVAASELLYLVIEGHLPASHGLGMIVTAAGALFCTLAGILRAWLEAEGYDTW